MASAKPYHTNIIITSISIIAHLMAPILSYIAVLSSAIYRNNKHSVHIYLSNVICIMYAKFITKHLSYENDVTDFIFVRLCNQ